jgi:phenylpropionate dioxygenase-like ring-hydroxylating dioxygenase large terminal subunit
MASEEDFAKRSKTPAYTPVRRVDPAQSPETPAGKAPDPELGTELIDARRYTSREFMALEWERLWTKVWLLGARLLDIPEAGDYVVTEIGRESILIVRQEGGAVRAFYNVCQHRGNRLRDCGLGTTGEARSFTCAYHHWEYELDGSYRRIPDIETFPQGRPPRGLREVKCDTWGGFVWYTLNDSPEPLRDFLGPIPQHLDAYSFDRMVQTRDITVEWHCNWKTSVDAFNESYHVQGIHPQLLWYLHDLDIQIDCYERHSRYLIPFGTVSPRVRRPPSIPEPVKTIMKLAGMDPADYDGPIGNIRTDVQKHKRAHGKAQGRDYSRLNDDQLTDDYHYLIFPNLSLNVHADDFWIFRQRPHPTDPDRMFYDILT